ncbi:hypothetical protein NL108_007607, partial [Boleophthalmus pectinirostris]
VLVLYFKYFLNWNDDFATSIYHVFVALCYLTPILGAIVADSWLGKFKTIIYLSIVYALGQIAMAISAIHDITDQDRNGTPDNMTFHVVLSMVGLFLIALGTGGIKPCVAAFGGDQFTNEQENQRRTFFSVFYLCINGGSLLSTIITPILRAQQCGIHTKMECYPLAFGVPAALMVVALGMSLSDSQNRPLISAVILMIFVSPTVVFIVGSPMYFKAKPQGNIMLDVCKCIGFAIKNRYRHRSKRYPKREHWMDWAEEKYGKLLIAQIKMALKVLFLYLPLPMFWTLFDQKGSRWTLQATTLNGDFGAFIVQPDQMQTFNPILILTLVPIMDNVIYPLIKKCGLNFTPLKRMTVGMFLAAMAFVCAAVVQLQIDKTLPTFPSASESQLKLLNMAPNQISVQLPGNSPLQLSPNQASPEYYTFDTDTVTVSIGSPPTTRTIALTKGKRQTLLIPGNLANTWELTNDLISKPEKGANAIRFVNGLSIPINISTAQVEFGITNPFLASNYSLLKNGKYVSYTIIRKETSFTSIFLITVMMFKSRQTFTFLSASESCTVEKEFGFGSSYTYFIPSTFTFTTNCGEVITEAEEIKPNTVHMALQIPQYFFITAGEVMFSVTGLEFSYSQAPSNMKAVLQAGWLLTVAVGNFIVLIVAELAKLPKQ